MSINVYFEAQTAGGPRIVRIVTNSALATVEGAGWLNSAINEGFVFLPTDKFLVSYSTGVNFFSASVSNGIWTLSLSTGDTVLPVVSGNFAVFSGTSGSIADLGYLPSNAAKTKVVMANGVTVANEIAVFADTAGTVKDADATATLGQALIVSGSVSAGKSATAGILASFPSAATSGSLRLVGVASSGNFNVDISNASHGQATVYSLADIGASTGGIPVSTAPIKIKSVNAAAAAGGAAAQSFTDAFCTSSSVVIGNWITQANAAGVVKIVPGNGSFVVTSTADAGVGTFNYVIIK